MRCAKKGWWKSSRSDGERSGNRDIWRHSANIPLPQVSSQTRLAAPGAPCPFDEDFGPGSRVGSGEDTDYIFRAYLAGATLEYVPDMAVSHYHGRKTSDDGRALFRRYLIGSGALNVKYLRKHPNLCRQTYWDLKHVVKEIVTGSNTFLPSIGFSHKDKLACIMRGAVMYSLLRDKHNPAASLSSPDGR